VCRPSRRSRFDGALSESSRLGRWEEGVEDDLHLFVRQKPGPSLFARGTLEAGSQEVAYCQPSDTKIRRELFRANVLELLVLLADASEIDTPVAKVLAARAVTVRSDEVGDAALVLGGKQSSLSDSVVSRNEELVRADQRSATAEVAVASCNVCRKESILLYC
jgi:hypothetical protein